MKISSIKDSLLTVKTNKKTFLNQKVLINDKYYGIVVKIFKENVNILVNKEVETIEIKKIIFSNSPFSATFNDSYLGNIINVFGENINGNKLKKSNAKYNEHELFSIAPSFIDRKALSKPLETGLFAIDVLIPIGKGQRQLIIGDRRTGKTSITLTTIINNKNIKFIYVSIGQKNSSISFVKNILEKNNAFKNVTIINVSPSEKLNQYIAPYVGMSMAEGLRDKGEDVVVIFDDLTKHANIYREIKLNLGITGGREAYPSDLFFLHSRLLERSGSFNDKFGGGSITAFPIVETIEEDFATLLATNIISITDGQIITDQKKSMINDFPSLNIEKSVSRIGSIVQTKEIKSISKNISKIYQDYLNYSNYESISEEITDEVNDKLNKGKFLVNSFKQNGYVGMSKYSMIIKGIIISNISIEKKSIISLKEAIDIAENDPIGIKIFKNIVAGEKNYDFDLYIDFVKGIMNIDNKNKFRRFFDEG
ncbi:MAG: hypothetical protein K4H23_02530 [Mollicutes bacterium PWAP]|nr:hypothetical protein [Mollicutes bacterium PWAP]